MASPGAQAGRTRARLAHEIGTRIRELRVGQNLSQADLARKAGTSQAAIARLEAGGTEPRLSTLEKLCTVLGAKLSVELVA